jgi:hypothetical protein
MRLGIFAKTLEGSEPGLGRSSHLYGDCGGDFRSP